MTIRPNPDKVAQLHRITLDHGSHLDFKEGHCAMEVVAWLADQGHTDAPTCTSAVISGYVIALNDRWGGEQRQALKPYLVAMIGTGSDEKNAVRRDILQRSVAELTSPWLRLAGLHEHAEALDNAITAEGTISVMTQANQERRTLKNSKEDIHAYHTS